MLPWAMGASSWWLTFLVKLDDFMVMLNLCFIYNRSVKASELACIFWLTTRSSLCLSRNQKTEKERIKRRFFISLFKARRQDDNIIIKVKLEWRRWIHFWFIRLVIQYLTVNPIVYHPRTYFSERVKCLVIGNFSRRETRFTEKTLSFLFAATSNSRTVPACNNYDCWGDVSCRWETENFFSACYTSI